MIIKNLVILSINNTLNYINNMSNKKTDRANDLFFALNHVLSFITIDTLVVMIDFLKSNKEMN